MAAMKVEQMMTHDVVACAPGDPLDVAREARREHEPGASRADRA
jgi:hypothetical protein